jgi:drug/metabolite transporter (DMT)-like permease
MAAGAAGSIGVLGLYVALSRGNMTVVAPVTGVVAAVVPVGVGIALGERPSTASALGIVLAIVAVGLIGGVVGVTHVAVHGPTVVLAVFVGVAFGLLFVAYSRTGDDAGLWPLLAARFGGAPLLASSYVVARRRRMIAPPNRSAVAPGMAVGAMVGLANLLYLLASRRGLLSIVAVVVSLYPASTVALAAVFDGERVSRSQAAGMVLAVVAVAAITSGS